MLVRDSHMGGTWLPATSAETLNFCWGMPWLLRQWVTLSWGCMMIEQKMAPSSVCGRQFAHPHPPGAGQVSYLIATWCWGLAEPGA